MNIDVHAHYVPSNSLEMAARLGDRHGLEAQKNDRGEAVPLRDGKPFLTQAKAEFSDLDLGLSIMDQQGVDMQVLSPAGSCPTLGAASIAVTQFKDSNKRKISKPPSDYVKLLYFDTITHSPMALDYLISNFGAERVLLGSDYPYDIGDPEALTLLSSSHLDPAQMRQVAGANACKLFHIGT
jgi:predicted TIM-barrel fold metal-dependent hydrolase